MEIKRGNMFLVKRSMRRQTVCRLARSISPSHFTVTQLELVVILRPMYWFHHLKLLPHYDVQHPRRQPSLSLPRQFQISPTSNKIFHLSNRQATSQKNMSLRVCGHSNIVFVTLRNSRWWRGQAPLCTWSTCRSTGWCPAALYRSAACVRSVPWCNRRTVPSALESRPYRRTATSHRLENSIALRVQTCMHHR